MCYVNWGSVSRNKNSENCNANCLEGINILHIFASLTRVYNPKLRLMKNLNSQAIANLSLACKYWGLARWQKDRKAAAAYYEKAYSILSREMGEKDPSTLDLRKEMAEFLSYQTAFQAVVRER